MKKMVMKTVGALFVLVGLSFSSPDAPPSQPRASTASDFVVHVVYKRVLVGSVRTDGPMLIVRGENLNFYYVGG